MFVVAVVLLLFVLVRAYMSRGTKALGTPMQVLRGSVLVVARGRAVLCVHTVRCCVDLRQLTCAVRAACIVRVIVMCAGTHARRDYRRAQAEKQRWAKHEKKRKAAEQGARKSTA